MPRLFVAVWPPDDLAAELTALQRKDQRGVRFVRPENCHVTLRFLGEADPDEVIDALDAATFAPARARVGPGIDIVSDHALVVPVHGLEVLAAEVAARTGHLGDPPRKRFVGHLTLARLKRGATMPAAIGAFMSAEFNVDEIALVQSRLDPDGARYETLQTWMAG